MEKVNKITQSLSTVNDTKSIFSSKYNNTLTNATIYDDISTAAKNVNIHTDKLLIQVKVICLMKMNHRIVK